MFSLFIQLNKLKQRGLNEVVQTRGFETTTCDKITNNIENRHLEMNAAYVIDVRPQ